jgi:hypothetical protein
MRFLLLFSLICPLPAHAGAWPMPQGEAQVIVSTFASQANNAFDNQSHATQPIKFEKLMSQAYSEYGLSDRWTAVLIPEFDAAQWSSPGQSKVRDSDLSVEGGVRALLFDSFGVLSLQGTAKTAGAHDSTSASDVASGRQEELRLLYGTNFEIAGCAGFADVEVAQRWIDGPKPDETPIDITLGFHVTKDVQVLAQSFNIISGSNGDPSGYYRSHKLQLSAVVGVTDSLSVQAGGFVSPAGQNALHEQGLFVAMWEHF